MFFNILQHFQYFSITLNIFQYFSITLNNFQYFSVSFNYHWNEKIYLKIKAFIEPLVRFKNNLRCDKKNWNREKMTFLLWTSSGSGDSLKISRNTPTMLQWIKDKIFNIERLCQWLKSSLVAAILYQADEDDSFCF